MGNVTILQGDVRQVLRAQLGPESVHTCVTSPPYYGGVRNYSTESQVWGGVDGCEHDWQQVRTPRPNAAGGATPKQDTNPGSRAVDYHDRASYSGVCSHCHAWKGELGSEPTLELYIEHLADVCDEVWRVLRSDGTFWLNLGDVFASNAPRTDPKNSALPPTSRHPISGPLKPGDLCLAPHKVAIELQRRGWWVRMDCVWGKGVSFDEEWAGSCMPYPVTDRPHKSHEYVFLLTKSQDYFYDHYAVKEAYSAKSLPQVGVAYNGAAVKDYAGANAQNASDSKRRIAAGMETNGGRNLRSVWMISSGQYAGSHTATFPLELPFTCLTASTSRHGACASCGAQWEQRLEKTETVDPSAKGSRFDAGKTLAVQRRVGQGERYLKQATGWQKTCTCDTDEVRPPVVLDPFSGSGTTGVAAAQLGCDYIGTELNPEEARQSEIRISIEGAGRKMRFGKKPREEQGALSGLFSEKELVL